MEALILLLPLLQILQKRMFSPKDVRLALPAWRARAQGLYNYFFIFAALRE